MKRFFHMTVWSAVLYVAATAAGSCTGMAPAREVYRVDSLNRVAYACRYKDIDSSFRAAEAAHRQATFYRQGKAEACNNLGFCAFMRLDFELAEHYHREVYGLTQNELELLIADIGLMKIYQRRALNKEFYDYRISALRRMKRIGEENALFADKHERMRLDYARSEFYIVSAIYYYYLQQRTEALACIGKAAGQEGAAADTCQLLYYHYVKGAAALCDGETPDENRLKEFDHLYLTWKLAAQQGMPYFEGCGMQGMVDLMVSPERFDFFCNRRSYALVQLGEPVDTAFPLRLAQQALQKFSLYKDVYQLVGTYVSIGKYLNAHGSYQTAIDTLERALGCISHHQAVPECILSINEQLSVAYAGMGMKEYSDYHRNIYLDILDDTRQDKELESRYQALEKGSRQLNWLLALVIGGILGVSVFLYFFNARSKVRNRRHLHRLQCLLEVCQKITAAIPGNAHAEEEITAAIEAAIRPDMEKLFGTPEVDVRNGRLVLQKHLSKDERAMVQVIEPYVQWALDNGMASLSLGEELRRLEKQRYIHEQHIAGNKRQNIVKKACLSIVNGIHPYIGRILNEVRKLAQMEYPGNEIVRKERYQYVDELVTTINEYNDILAQWIKMKQGTLHLNVETFGLDELFELLKKGSRTFEAKQIQLVVEPTDACVKADKALTLFMINTLMENARKYTPCGGMVRIYARRAENYVEVSVADNGRGLSEADVYRIVHEKVYDSKEIGMDNTDHPEELKKSKGSGFGLMNCKGIIEKYRKTNALFSVCLFDVESTPGKGSRFYFRLPAGVRKALLAVAVVCTAAFGSCTSQEMGGTETTPPVVAGSSATTKDGKEADTAARGGNPKESGCNPEYERLLDQASGYADAAYFSNVGGTYEMTLQYADSALHCLNAHCRQYAPSALRSMTLTGDGTPAELEWWAGMFDSDFHVILDVRNEAAIAFLALRQWDGYNYNNTAYTTLYKLLGEDQSLEEYCRVLERSTNNKLVGILLLVLLFVTLCLGYYILYFRRRLVNRWNLEQILEINRQVFTAATPPMYRQSDMPPQEEETLGNIPRQIAEKVFGSIDELLDIDSLCIAVYHENRQRLEYAFAPGEPDTDPPSCKELMRQCFEQQTGRTEQRIHALPLLVEAGSSTRCIGVLAVERSERQARETDHLLLELVARYMAIVLFNTVIKLSVQYRDIEEAQDEVRRAFREESLLHVQNMVLDNCLSTIKHETIYYPNKIKQSISRLRSGGLTEMEERETTAAILELVEYYKGIFTLLSLCASRQLADATFRRSTIAVAELTDTATRYFRKSSNKRQGASLSFRVEPVDARVVGDLQQLHFLLENLIDEALSVGADGEISLTCLCEEKFVRFCFTDTRRSKTAEELYRLFYPDKMYIAPDEKGDLRGTEYLICKQIIREHDEFAGRRGCRIGAQAASKGFTVYFTLPLPPSHAGTIGQ